MDIYLKMDYHIFSLFLVFNQNFIIYIDFAHIAFKQQLMTSQIRSHIE